MKTLIVTMALGAGLIAAPALAQAPGGGWGQRDQTRAEAQQRADMMFQMLDANKDGIVTRAEAEQALAQFQAAQGGESGGQGAGRGRMMQRMIEQLFATSSSVTRQQFEALALARFDAMDLNHDGIVTVDERRTFREQQGQVRPNYNNVLPPPPAATAPAKPQ